MHGHQPTQTLMFRKMNSTVISVPRLLIIQRSWKTVHLFDLRSVQIGYNLNSAALQRIDLTNLRIYAQGTNLFLITNYSGLDPEVSGGTGQRGIDSGAYVQEKGVAVGLNISF